MYANVPRSSLHVIQLALLCKVTDLQRCLYESVLSPLIKDLHTLEPNGIFTWPVSWVSQLIIWRPMVLQVLCNLFEDTTSADSVAEKFKTAKFQMVSLPWEQRPDMINMCAMLYREKMQFNLVFLGMCSQQDISIFTTLPVSLQIYCTLQWGYCACWVGLVHLWNDFTLDYLNNKIQTFLHSYKLDKPQPVPKSSQTKHWR